MRPPGPNLPTVTTARADAPWTRMQVERIGLRRSSRAATRSGRDPAEAPGPARARGGGRAPRGATESDAGGGRTRGPPRVAAPRRSPRPGPPGPALASEAALAAEVDDSDEVAVCARRGAPAARGGVGGRTGGHAASG